MEVLSSDIKEVLDHYTLEDWRALWKRLRRFTNKYYAWLPSAIGGIELDDLIQDAIDDALIGKRRWPPEVNLVTFLCNVIRSNASHMCEKHGKVDSLEDLSITYLQTPPDTLYPFQRENEDRQNGYLQLCDKVRELVRDDELLSRMVSMWLEAEDLKPKEIAHRLGVPIEAIRSAQKRLSRKTTRLREEWRNVQGG